ncbi:MAG: sensor histidine kinase N-terminal domain-containing protein [Rhodospirillales bacterium]|nr:sensor histidine kinase N-terminal domain-containing protein [Rhodospirillales bacterium]
MKQTYSLRSRLIAWISIPIIVATLLALGMSYHFAKKEIEEVYDAQLVHSAKVLLQLIEHEIAQDKEFDLGLENPDLQHKYERKFGFRIWVDNNIITQSSNTGMFAGFEAPPGFSNQTIGKHDWRFFVFLDPANNIKIEVSERYDIRYELVIQLMGALILPAILFVPLIFLIVWIGVRKVLKPVVKISADVDRRGSDDLSSIEKDVLPQEIAPLIQALNRLFKRIEESFRREREFTDHAAHELRTPLAAMKTQTQVLMKKAATVPECAEGLENLQSSINRSAHLIEQLLSLARLQNEALPKGTMNLSECLLDAVANIRPRAEEKTINLTMEIAEDVNIHAHGASIDILLSNLLDNAVKYTPVGGSVHISLEKSGTLKITDTGPGLSDKDKSRVFERFVRADKSGQNGSGLGLSIVKWICDVHGADISLDNNVPSGLVVTVTMESV